MKTRAVCLLSAVLLVISSSLAAECEDARRSYPVPVVELERVAWYWFTRSSFQVTRTSLPAGQVLLKASRGREGWQVSLRPRSALATEISAQCVVDERSNQRRVEELWAHLDEYLQDTITPESRDDREGVPEAVLPWTKAVVCIKVTLQRGQVQLSGFAIDSNGLILATAHDLNGVKDIEVVLQDGRTFKGHLLKADSHRDLALIDIGARMHSTIVLSRARSELAEGERLFALGCPADPRLGIHSAVVIGPPRLINGLPIWQVTMQALPGSSGSPVFDAAGRLVAMVRGRYRGTESVGFLTPWDTMREFLKGK